MLWVDVVIVILPVDVISAQYILRESETSIHVLDSGLSVSLCETYYKYFVQVLLR